MDAVAQSGRNFVSRHQIQPDEFGECMYCMFLCMVITYSKSMDQPEVRLPILLMVN